MAANIKAVCVLKGDGAVTGTVAFSQQVIFFLNNLQNLLLMLLVNIISQSYDYSLTFCNIAPFTATSYMSFV